MIRWIIVIFVILVLVNWFSPILHKLGFGKLPGDFRFRLFGREMYLPVTTTRAAEHGGRRDREYV